MVEYIGDSLSPNYLGGDNHCPSAVTVTLTVFVTVAPPTPTQPPPEPSAAPAVCPPQGPSPADPTAKERLWQFFVPAAGSSLDPFLSFIFKAEKKEGDEREAERKKMEKAEGDEEEKRKERRERREKAERNEEEERKERRERREKAERKEESDKWCLGRRRSI
ncbi:hypothetical protein BGX38DRAFT_1279007 [Terfezia claveryi]|nr:hypothetical protein BGX38DRAFT_1279007 [Terfezia claveryi]